MEYIDLFELGNRGSDKFKRVRLDVRNNKVYIYEGELIWKNGGYDSSERKTDISFNSLKNYAKSVSKNLFKLYEGVSQENWQQTLPQVDENKVLLFEFKYHESDIEKSYFYIDKNTGVILLSKKNAPYLEYIEYEGFKIIGERFSNGQYEKYKDMNENNWRDYIYGGIVMSESKATDPDLGEIIYVSDKNLMCQVFPEGVKQSMIYVCVMTDKVMYFPDNPTSFNTDVIAGACNKITDDNRIIPFDDIERAVYPSEDVKIMLWMKRKGNRTIRIYRKSTGKYCDICIGKPEDTKNVYDKLIKMMGKN